MGIQVWGHSEWVDLEGIDALIFGLIRDFHVHAPEYQKLPPYFYSRTSLPHAEQIERFKQETIVLRKIYRHNKKMQLQRDKKIHAKDRKVVEDILRRLLADDKWLRKFDRIIAVCDDALRHNVALEVEGE